MQDVKNNETKKNSKQQYPIFLVQDLVTGKVVFRTSDPEEAYKKGEEYDKPWIMNYEFDPNQTYIF